MIEKQAFRIVFAALLHLAACLALVSCQADRIPTIQLPKNLVNAANPLDPKKTVTRTPFQAQSPTIPPTSTATPFPISTPTLIPTETPEPCLSRQGQIESHTVEFSNPSLPLTFRVYLPPCYGLEDGYRYPVLYIIHGQTYKDDQWDRLGIDEAADAMIKAKEAPPFLIVMPLEVDTFEDIYSASFSKDLVNGLVPWMDANYTTCAERACRAIGGLSRGGAWAFRLGFLHWDIFGAVGMHSTPPFTGDPNQLSNWLRQIPADQVPRVWMDTGKRDAFLAQTSQLEQLLVLLNVPHEWYLFNGAHDEEYWSAHVADYLAWYTQPWK
ncbi:MAG: esterase family protein [Anaerolineaceae bacterium]|nr:esterase family protein [Anaerolineaceae bacterium]